MKRSLSQKPSLIGVFSSRYDKLAILNEIREALLDYDYICLSGNAHIPYGARSFEIVYKSTLQAVNRPFRMGYHLVILACNTASARALRTIQMNNLPDIDPSRKILEVTRPTVECIGSIIRTRHAGALAVVDAIELESYPLEIHKLFSDIKVSGEAYPMWIPLVENNKANGERTDFFIRKYIHNLLAKDRQIDTIILGCTHCLLLLPKIQQLVPQSMEVVAQGEYVAASLRDYLYGHPEMDRECTQEGNCSFRTTETEDKFVESIPISLNQDATVQRISLE